MQNLRSRRGTAIQAACWITLALAAVSGCSSDERLVQVATDSARRQAEQTRDALKLQEQVAEGTKSLVASESQARQHWVLVQQQLQEQQGQLGRQRDLIEADRRAIAIERHEVAERQYYDPIFAAAIETGGCILLAIVALLVTAYALRLSFAAPVNASMADVLVWQMLRQGSRGQLQPPEKSRTDGIPLLPKDQQS